MFQLFATGAKRLFTDTKRSLFIILSASALFSLVFLINLWFQGLQSTYLHLAAVTNDRVVISATTEDAMLAGALTPERQHSIAADIEAHGGHLIGAATYFGAYQSIVLPAHFLTDRILIDPSQAPDDAAPTLVSTFLGEQLLGHAASHDRSDLATKTDSYTQYRQALLGRTFTDISGAKYYIIGFAPSNFRVANLSFAQIDPLNQSPLNPALELISTPHTPSIVVDNDKSALWQKGTVTPAETNGRPADPNNRPAALLAYFDHADAAYQYLRNSHAAFFNLNLPDRTYAVEVVAGTSPEALYRLQILRLFVVVASAILLLIAAIIVILSSIRFVDRDRSNIALYYHLGATTRQVKCIYLGYFLTLMLTATLVAFLVATLIIAIFNLTHQDLLSAQALLGFALPAPRTIWWYGLSPELCLSIVIALLLAPLCTLINFKPLSIPAPSSQTP